MYSFGKDNLVDNLAGDFS